MFRPYLNKAQQNLMHPTDGHGFVYNSVTMFCNTSYKAASNRSLEKMKNQNPMLKKSVVILFMLSLFFGGATASASTINSAKPYMPSTKYSYSVYDKYAYPKKDVVFKCKKWDASHLHCARSGGGTYTYRVTKKIFTFNDGGDTPIVTPYHFPLTKGKTYYKTGYEGMSSYKYSYKIMTTNMKKKIGKKTYTNVIKIRNNYDQGFTYIAKNHGVVLITTKQKGKQVAIYKVKTYY